MIPTIPYSDEQERKIVFQEFQDNAFSHVPTKAIVSLLRGQQTSWFKISTGNGSEYLKNGKLSIELQEASGGNMKNIIFLLVEMDKKAIVLFEQLREKADFFEFSSGLQVNLNLVLFFVKKEVK